MGDRLPGLRPGLRPDRRRSDVHVLVPLSAGALEALVAGDVGRASEAVGLALPDAFLGQRDLWVMRLGQLGEQPGIEGWLAHAVVREDRVVVGDAGFHGPPDDAGMVEVGYTIYAEHRRQGHARAALARLIELATERGVTTVRASVGPWNAPSLALVRSFGFVQVGEQMDDVDGLELVLERPA